jgi:hypothetical protein
MHIKDPLGRPLGGMLAARQDTSSWCPGFGRGIIMGKRNLAKIRGRDLYLCPCLYLAPSRARVTFSRPSCLPKEHITLM